MSEASFQSIEHLLKSNIHDVYKLAEFDRVILDVAINQLQLLEDKLNKEHLIDDPKLTAINTRKSLENVRGNRHYNHVSKLLITNVLSYLYLYLLRQPVIYIAI